MLRYLSKESSTCLKEQIMHKELSLAMNMLKHHTCINSFENSMKPDINSQTIENSVKKSADLDLHCFPHN